MNYTTTNLKEVNFTRDDILSRVDEKSIYNKYTNLDVSLKKQYSPFVKEKTPSFSFFYRGEWLWKDFSSGKGGDCIGLVSELFNISYKEAIQKIAYDFNILKYKIDAIRIQQLEVIKEYKRDPVKIEVVIDSWTDEYINYWKQYELSVKDIDNETTFIKPCKEVWVRDSWVFYNKLVDKDICFRYRFSNSYKIYRPETSKKEDKWLSNTTIDTIQNISNINNYPKELLIITKSYKDSICLNKLGFNSISFSSEATINVDSIMDWLKSEFKEIVIFYDNDVSGIKYSKAISDKYNLQNIIIPIQDDGIKDISDFIKEYSMYEANELLKTIL